MARSPTTQTSLRAGRMKWSGLKMRLLLATCCTLLVLLTSAGEARAQEKTDIYSTATVRGWLQSHAQGFSASFIEKRVPRLGDRAAISLLKVLKDEEVTDPAKVKLFLPLMHAAFDSPNSITLPEDRQPQVTLLLLNYLKQEVGDLKLKKEIDLVISFIKEKTSPR